MMRHVPSPFARGGRWLCNNSRSIRDFIVARCGFPATHAQRGGLAEDISSLNDAAVSEFSLVPLLMKWARCLPEHGGGVAARTMAESLIDLLRTVEFALDITVDSSIDCALVAGGEQEVSYPLALSGGGGSFGATMARRQRGSGRPCVISWAPTTQVGPRTVWISRTC